MKKIVAGVDEVGRGSLIGPVYAAAVIFNPKINKKEIKDSKKLKKIEREKLSKYIKKNSIWSVGSASVKEIERLNILNATLLAMKRAIRKLKKKPNLTLIDGNKTPHMPYYNLRYIVKGDQKIPEISAASIIAKVSRDKVIKNLSKKFNEVYAVKNVNFTIGTNKTIGLLGPNGCGKTTSIGMMLGLIKPTTGDIIIQNKNINTFERNKLLSIMNFASPYVELPKKLSVKQNLQIYGRLYGVKDLSLRIDELAEDLNLKDFINKKTGELSSGQKNRVSLAKSLINKPEILLLDEPTASLDPDIGDYVRSYVQSYKSKNKVTILLASHNMAEVERLCDSVIMMKKGKIIDQGTSKEIINRHGRTNLEETFLKIVRSKDEVA